jgi:UDP-glucose 4-epimerase
MIGLLIVAKRRRCGPSFGPRKCTERATRLGTVVEMVRMRVVVLGRGFIGSEVARALADRSCDVVVVARSFPADMELPPGATARPVDVANRLDLAAELATAHAVVYAVGSPPPAVAASADDLGLHQSLLPLLSTIECLRVVNRDAHLVYLSSGGAVYGNIDGRPIREQSLPRPVSAYGVLKLTGEQFIDSYVQTHGLRASMLRVSNAYGPGQPVKGQGAVAAFMFAARLGQPATVYGDGSSVRDYIHVADVADVVAEVASGDGSVGTVNVGTGVGTSLIELAEAIRRVSGVPLDLRFVPARSVDVRANVLDVAAMRRAVPAVTPRDLHAGLEQTWRSLCR